MRAGVYRLTPALAKMLGPSDDGALLEDADARKRAWGQLDAELRRVA